MKNTKKVWLKDCKFTKGPWEIESIKDHGSSVRSKTHGVGVAWCGSNFTVGLVDGKAKSYGITQEEAKGNAILISKMHDMLETLKVLADDDRWRNESIMFGAFTAAKMSQIAEKLLNEIEDDLRNHK